MKRILAVAFIVGLATGCASPTGEGSYGKMIALGFVSPELAGHEAVKLGLAKYPTEQAIENCQKMGYRNGTSEYRQCVTTTANNIRHARAIENSNRSKTVTCQRWLDSIRCTEN